MGAIGNYIHLNAKNYNKHGISKKGNGASYEFGQQKKIIKNRLLSNSKTKNKNLRKIEKALNIIFSGESGAENNSLVAEIHQLIEKMLNEKFKEKAGIIDFETGNVIAENSLVKKRVKALQSIQISDNQKSIYISTIMKRIKYIQACYNGNFKNIEDKEKIEKKIKDIENGLKSLGKDVEAAMKDFDINPKLIKSGKGLKLSLEEDENSNSGKIRSLVEELNSIIALMGAAPPISLQKGEVFEYATALASYLMDDKAKTISNEEIKKMVKGGTHKENVHFKQEYFSVPLGDVGLKATIDKVSGSEVFVSSSNDKSLGKVDVEFKLGKNNLAKISAKNINLQSGFDISLVDKTSLLFLLQDESSDFVNHYLNLAAAHGQPKDEPIDQSKLREARDVVKFTVFAKALLGGAQGRDSANIFLVNDNSRKGQESIKAYDMRDIINTAYRYMDRFVTASSGSLKEEDLEFIDNYCFKNDFIEGDTLGKTRISKLLADVHSKKISVSLNPSILQKIK